MSHDGDLAYRLAVSERISTLRSVYSEDGIPSAELDLGVMLDGARAPIWNKYKGIYRPASLRDPGAALSIMTSHRSPYDDRVDVDQSFMVYKYQGTDPQNPDNVALRRAYELRKPLLYLIGLSKGRYEALFPCFITRDNPSMLEFHVMVDAAIDLERAMSVDPSQVEGRRAYRTVAAKVRLHQRHFRLIVLGAYQRQCAMCRLRHIPLLDAAHILPDGDPRGLPVIPNGLSLCKIHHSAYDVGILGVDPDYRIHLRHDVLEEHDGPMLRHGLQEMHGTVIHTPRAPSKKPDRDFLADRFAKFLAA